MRKGRKTVSVESIVDQVNTSLKESTCSADIRLGMCTVVEQVLMASGNYNGFRYLDKNEVPKGQLPGVRIDEDGQCLTYEERFANTDDSRRQYYHKCDF